MGVRAPVMRRLNKQVIDYCKADPKKGKALLEKMWNTGSYELMWMAEDGVRGLSTENALKFADKIKSGINNWIHSDTLLCAMRQHGKSEPEKLMNVAEKYSRNKQPWIKRLGIIFPIIVIGYYPRYIDRTLAILARNMEDEREYIVKAVSWTCASCYMQQKGKTAKWLRRFDQSSRTVRACYSRIRAYQKRRN